MSITCPRAAAAVVLVALWLVACGTGSGGEVFDLQVGDCFDDPDEPVEQLAEVPLIGCEQPHDNQVFALFDLPGQDFPGDAQVTEQARDGCLARFEDYVGSAYEESELFAAWLPPTQASWQAGDREVVCVLFAEDGPLVGSQQGSGR